MTKKRKAELDLDVERNLHSSFVTAANSISHLFTQAIQQNKKAQVAGAQQALVSLHACFTGMFFILAGHYYAESSIRLRICYCCPLTQLVLLDRNARLAGC